MAPCAGAGVQMEPNPETAPCTGTGAQTEQGAEMAPFLENLDDLPPWPCGLGVIVGPSGSGKTRCLRQLATHYGHQPTRQEAYEFPEHQAIVSNKGFGSDVNQALNQLQSSGLNCIPAWTRPMHVLSTGQQDRVRVALQFSSAGEAMCVIDDFAATVDHNTARTTAAAIAKRVKAGHNMLIATSRPEVVQWLAPDFVISAETKRILRRPPELPKAQPKVTIVPRFGRFIAGKDRQAGERCGWEIRRQDPEDPGAKPAKGLKWNVEGDEKPLKVVQVQKVQKLTTTVEVDDAVEGAAAAFEYEFSGTCETEIPQLVASDLPAEYQIGVLVGPSGTGKSSLLKGLATVDQARFPEEESVERTLISVVGAEIAAELLDAVSLPQSCRHLPRRVLSSSEGCRADAARALAVALAQKTTSKIAVDEWTSVCDRGTAKRTCEALGAWLRKAEGLPGVIFATVHEDIVEWLRPDWAFHTGSRHLSRRQGRGPLKAVSGAQETKACTLDHCFAAPSVTIEVMSLRHLDREDCKKVWETHFEEHHYLRGGLSTCACCLLMRCKETRVPVAFHASMPFPGRVKDAWREHRLVTRPEWQGLRLGPSLSNLAAARFHAGGFRFYSTTAHPRLAASRNQAGSGWVSATGAKEDGSRLAEADGIGVKIKTKKRKSLDTETDAAEKEDPTAPSRRRRRVFSHRYDGLCQRESTDFAAAAPPCKVARCLLAASLELVPAPAPAKPDDDRKAKAGVQSSSSAASAAPKADGDTLKKRTSFELASKTWICPVPDCHHRMVAKSAGCRAHMATIHLKEAYEACRAKDMKKAHHGCRVCVPAHSMDDPGAPLRYAVSVADVCKTIDSLCALEPFEEEPHREPIARMRLDFFRSALRRLDPDTRELYRSTVLAGLPSNLSAEAQALVRVLASEASGGDAAPLEQ
eukprot:TRINITY_DN25258_c0_g10_i1.p1 TRINITY_DN25258_c0_g10~~TRINITY_DN25258_c0_g10_i1.p1  ORF type:complete len:1013 (+),score=196.50 TRINITY_DN25258_c0_g10_i1:273-3041(+)